MRGGHKNLIAGLITLMGDDLENVFYDDVGIVFIEIAGGLIFRGAPSELGAMIDEVHIWDNYMDVSLSQLKYTKESHDDVVVVPACCPHMSPKSNDLELDRANAWRYSSNEKIREKSSGCSYLFILLLLLKKK